MTWLLGGTFVGVGIFLTVALGTFSGGTVFMELLGLQLVTIGLVLVVIGRTGPTR